MKKILIITSSFDLTVDYIIRKYYKQCDFYRLNIDIPASYFIKVENDKIVFYSDSFSEISLSEISAIYFRKISFPKLKGIYDEKYHPFVNKEIYTLVTGLVESFDGKCLTRPSILRLAENKIYQLKVASNIGFNIPKSLITNSKKAIECLPDNQNKIIKPIASGRIELGNIKEYVQTNLLQKDIPLSEQDLCPVYIQNYIEKDYDLRVTIVQDKIFAVKIESDNKVDWRKDYNSLKYTCVEIPERITEKCILFLEKVNMDFGIFDFVIKNNEYYFLELNPNGQWGWLEKELGINISGAILDYLIGD